MVPASVPTTTRSQSPDDDAAPPVDAERQHATPHTHESLLAISARHTPSRLYSITFLLDPDTTRWWDLLPFAPARARLQG